MRVGLFVFFELVWIKKSCRIEIIVSFGITNFITKRIRAFFYFLLTVFSR
jgi:hypothetical protein